MTTPEPDDLVDLSEACLGTLSATAALDWARPAGDLAWTCRQTLEHMASLAFASQLAMRATSFEPLAFVVAPDTSIDRLLRTVRVQTRILAEVALAAPSNARAFHPAGMADASGWLAMAMDELMLHTYDISAGLGIHFDPSKDAARTVLNRLFPWWPRSVDPWDALLWANGRRSLPGFANPGDSWLWHCRPLEEWDGTIPAWDSVHGRPVRS